MTAQEARDKSIQYTPYAQEITAAINELNFEIEKAVFAGKFSVNKVISINSKNEKEIRGVLRRYFKNLGYELYSDYDGASCFITVYW